MLLESTKKIITITIHLMEICPDVADYAFTSVLRLRADFQRGRFALAFQPEQRATVH